MDLNKIAKLPNVELLLSELLLRGFTKKVAIEQINELSEIIWLCALDQIAKNKKLDLSKLNNLNSREKLVYIEEKISEEELLEAIESISEEKITAYLNAIKN